jgi:hypothetical protein
MGLREQLTTMSPREQRLLAILGSVFGAMIFLGLPVYFYSNLSDARARNQDIRDVMRRMDKASDLLAKRRGERLALDLRYAKPAPALASFIEKAASANGLEVPESTDQQTIEGKGYKERVTSAKLRKVGLKPLVKMLERIERSGHPVSISKLSIKAKATGPDLYDVNLAVSAFDKDGLERASSPAKSDKPKRPAPTSKKGRTK